MSVWEVQTELEAEGYRLEKVVKELPWQNIFFLTVASERPGPVTPLGQQQPRQQQSPPPRVPRQNAVADPLR